MGVRLTTVFLVSVFLGILVTGSGKPPTTEGEDFEAYTHDLLEREANVRGLYEVVESHLNRGEFAEARLALLPILSLDLHHPLAFLGAVLVQHRQGSLDEAEGLLRSLAPAEGPGPLYGRGVLRFLQGRNAEARESFLRAAEMYAQRRHLAGVAASRTGLGNVLLRAGRYEEALAAYQWALRVVEGLGDQRSVADSLSNLGNVRQLQGDDGTALELYRHGLRIREESDDREGLATIHYNIGLISGRRGEHSAATESLERALRIRREIGDRSGEMEAINAIGLVHLDAGEGDRAAESFERSLALARTLGDRRGEADALTNLASVDVGSGRLQEALEKHLQAFAIRRQAGDRAGEGASLNNAASVREMMAAWAEALRLYEASLQIQRDLGDRRGEAILLVNLGRLSVRLGAGGTGTVYLRRSVEIYQSLADRRGEAAAREALGRALTDTADYPQALENLTRSLEIQRAVADPTGTASSLDALGVLAGRLADFARAVAHFEAALRLQKEAGDPSAEAATLNHLANVHFARGELTEALRQQEKSASIHRALHDGREEAVNLNNIGAIYQAIGDERRAMNYIGESLDRMRSLSDRAGEALARANLGVLLEDAGDLGGALREYRESIRIRESIGDRRGAALSRHNLAGILALLGRPKEARHALETALRTCRTIGDRGGEAVVLSGLGDLLRLQERFEPALDLYRQALGLARAGGMREEIWRCEAGLAACHEAAGRWEEALQALDRALEAVESVRVGLISDEFKARFLAGKVDLHENAARLLWKHARGDSRSDAAARAFEYAERARARGLLDLLTESRADLRRGVDPSLLSQEAALLARIARTARELPNTPGEGRRSLERALARSLEDLELLKVEMRRTAPRYAEIAYPEPAPAGDVRASLLRADEILLEYLLGEKDSYLWTVTRDEVRWQRLPPRRRIEPLVRRFLDLLRSSAAELGPEPSYRSMARELGQLLLPSDPLPAGKALLIVPDGILHYVPFEALRHPGRGTDSEGAFLVEDHEISYLPSASSLRLLREAGAGALRTASKILAVGDPVLTPEAIGDIGAGPLPFARQEVLRIGGLFGRGEALVLLGEQATEAAIKSGDFGDRRYLHFATHGWIDEEAPGRSGLLLGAAQEGAEDSLLSMNEIFTLRFRADLAVLSACRTGLGRLVRGEGMVSLTRAFLYAGARAVVVSLWNVADRSTADLMEAFYRRILGGSSPRSALREAKLGLLRSGQPSFRHPSRWAPFVLIGDPGESPPRLASRGSRPAEKMNLDGAPATHGEEGRTSPGIRRGRAVAEARGRP